MKLNFPLRHMGPGAGPDAIRAVAQRAEELDYHSIFVVERLLKPTNQRSRYLVTDDGVLPDYYKTVLDPLESLSYAAAFTRTIRLRTAVAVLPFHQPLILGRRLATIDVLSGGRLECGIGVGWNLDEYEAVGVPFESRGRRMDEFLRALKAVWSQDPVAFQGEFFTIPESSVGPKPVQQPHPPLYMAGFAPATYRRVVTLGNGWMPAGRMPLTALKQRAEQFHAAAQRAGRDASSFEMILMTFPQVTDTPLPDSRRPFTGTLGQLRDDVNGVAELGFTQINFDLNRWLQDVSLEEYLLWMERLRELA